MKYRLMTTGAELGQGQGEVMVGSAAELLLQISPPLCLLGKTILKHKSDAGEDVRPVSSDRLSNDASKGQGASGHS